MKRMQLHDSIWSHVIHASHWPLTAFTTMETHKTYRRDSIFSDHMVECEFACTFTPFMKCSATWLGTISDGIVQKKVTQPHLRRVCFCFLSRRLDNFGDAIDNLSDAIRVRLEVKVISITDSVITDHEKCGLIRNDMKLPDGNLPLINTTSFQEDEMSSFMIGGTMALAINITNCRIIKCNYKKLCALNWTARASMKYWVHDGAMNWANPLNKNPLNGNHLRMLARYLNRNRKCWLIDANSPWWNCLIWRANSILLQFNYLCKCAAKWNCTRCIDCALKFMENGNA